MKLADNVGSRRAWISWGILGIVLLPVAMTAPTSITFLMTTAAVYGILALSLNPILGGAGMLSMCQLTFAAVGAATMGLLGGQVSFPLAILIAAAAAMPFGLLLGAISLRLRGVSFAAASLGLATVGQIVISHNALPGFQSGSIVVAPAPLDTTRGYLFFVLTCFALLSIVTAWVRSARIGQTWSITRFNERAGASVGVSVPFAKLSATAMGAGIAGSAGALMVGQYGFITADAVAPINGLVLLVVAMVAGVGRVAGAWLAGLLFVVIPWLLTQLGLPGDVATILFGVVAVQVLASGADGVIGQLRGLAERQRLRRQGATPAARLDLSILDRVAEVERPLSPRSRLDVRGLTVEYGAVRALDAVTVELMPGSVTGLIGPNGAGKSTFIDAVTGFLPRYLGEVRLGGNDLARASARQRALRGVRRTFQQSRIPPEMTVAQYLDLCAGRRRSPARADAVAGPLAALPVGDLDIAARRLVEVAGAFAAMPEVVLLDEPAAGLSEADSLALAAAIRRLADRTGAAVLLVEHDVEMVRAGCDAVVVLDYGRVIAQGTPESVLQDGAVVAAYLGGELP
jgi:branched-chain amino acid transport system permease protein